MKTLNGQLSTQQQMPSWLQSLYCLEPQDFWPLNFSPHFCLLKHWPTIMAEFCSVNRWFYICTTVQLMIILEFLKATKEAPFVFNVGLTTCYSHSHVTNWSRNVHMKSQYLIPEFWKWSFENFENSFMFNIFSCQYYLGFCIQTTYVFSPICETLKSLCPMYMVSAHFAEKEQDTENGHND